MALYSNANEAHVAYYVPTLLDRCECFQCTCKPAPLMHARTTRQPVHALLQGPPGLLPPRHLRIGINVSC